MVVGSGGGFGRRNFGKMQGAIRLDKLEKDKARN